MLDMTLGRDNEVKYGEENNELDPNYTMEGMKSTAVDSLDIITVDSIKEYESTAHRYD
jgi:hypothetical protein